MAKITTTKSQNVYNMKSYKSKIKKKDLVVYLSLILSIIAILKGYNII